MSDVTRILRQIEEGDQAASDQLLPLVYEELRRLARVRMSNERSDHTLQPTALVHEAYVRLVDCKAVQNWDSRGHFFSAAAEAMRRILVDRARKVDYRQRQGLANQIELNGDEIAILPLSNDFLALDEALTELQNKNSQAAELVKLRFFVGLSHHEAADSLGVSRRVADRLWRVARAWLSREMNRE